MKSSPGHRGMLGVLVLAGGLAACSDGASARPDAGTFLTAELAQRAEVAVRAGLRALLAERGTHELGVLQTLRRVGTLRQDAQVLRFVADEAPRFEKDLYRALVRSDLPPVPLLVEAGRGHRKLQWYLTHAATAFDPERSRRILAEYLGLEQFGFGLTHQLFAILWAEETGVFSARPPVMEALVRRVRAEAEALPSFSDLFAEQVNLLLWIDATATVPSSWIEAILRAQGSDGRFVDQTTYRIDFDGETAEMRPGWAHTTAQAVAALAHALAR